MCMKNVNATLFFCSEMTTTNNQVSLLGIYDHIDFAKTTENEYCIDKLNIALNCSIIFDNKFNGDDSCIQLNKDYEFMIRLTNVSSDKGLTLDVFSVVVTEADLKECGKSYYELKRFLMIPRIKLPQGLGDYVVKILVRQKGKEVWNTQTIHSLNIS